MALWYDRTEGEAIWCIGEFSAINPEKGFPGHQLICLMRRKYNC
jgi:hypothetical protein